MESEPMFKSRTNDELMRAFNGMLAEAREKGIDVTAEAAVREFAGRESLLQHCTRLHTRIRGLTAHVGAGPGLRRLRSDSRAETTRQHVLADQQVARSAAATQRKTAMSEDTATDTATTTAAAKKAPAKKAPAKKAPAKKAPAKKAPAKKAPAKKAAAAAGSTGGGGRAFADDAVITVVAAENPRREGTAPHDRFKVVMKHNGKTVGQFLKAGGETRALRRAVSEKLAKVA
jgi:hypothetical protein